MEYIGGITIFSNECRLHYMTSRMSKAAKSAISFEEPVK